MLRATAPFGVRPLGVVALFAIGLALASILVIRRIRGGLLIGIIATTVVAAILNAIWGDNAIWDAVGPGIAQVPEGRQVFAPLSVEDNLRLGAWPRRNARLDAELASVYELFPVLASRRRISAGMLSGGEQQMLAIGRALMAKPRLLLLDEPSMGLAPMLVEQILDVVRGLKEAGLTVLLVEQNARAALAIADRGYVIETGRIATSGSSDELLADARVQAAYLGV